MTFLRENKRHIFILLMLSLLIVLPGISNMPLFDPDEPVYALTPLEMIHSGDWLSPKIYGNYWYDKPPLFYWLDALSVKAFGVSEFAVRFPSALLGILSVVMLYVFVTKRLGSKTGLIASIALLTSIEFVYLSKAAVIDITLLFCMSGALLCYWDKKYFWMYVCAALATLAKGPVGFLLPGAVMFCDMLLNNRWRDLTRMRLFSGVLAFLVIALPWYLAMWKVHGADFMDGFLGANNITRFLDAEHPGTSAYWFYIPVLFLGMFPWCGVIVQAFWSTIRVALNKWQEGNKDNPELFFNLWAWVIFIFFTLSQTKLITYIVPMFPAVAVLIAMYISGVSKKSSRRSFALVLTAVSLLLATAVVVGQALVQAEVFAHVTISIGSILNGMKQQLANVGGLWRGIAMALCFLICFGGVSIIVWRKGVQAAVQPLGCAMIITVFTLVYICVPAFYNQADCREFVPKFMEQYDGKSQIFVCKYRHPGFTYYSGINGIEIPSDSGSFKKSLAILEKMLTAERGTGAYFIVQDIYYNALSPNIRAFIKVDMKFYEKYVLQP